MDTTHLALSKGVTLVVHGLPIHVPRQPVSRKVRREWKRLLLHALRMADDGIVSPMGCVIPPAPRENRREWFRWYKYAYRKSSPVRDFSRPDLEEPPPPTQEAILKAVAFLADGKSADELKAEMKLTAKELRVLLKAVRKTGRKLLAEKYSQVMRRVLSLRAQDMEIARM